MSEIILSVKNVHKQYGDHKALDNVSFDVPKGSVFGLLGPNGAGKTSLIRIITNITQADQGMVTLNGVDTRELRRGIVGYMPEERGLYKKMKVFEQLMYLANLRGISKTDAAEKIEFWLRRLQLIKWAYKNVEELSKGMQQKVQFIATILHEPQFLILDEPFSGLDPVNTELLKEEILLLNKKGMTLMFSTHRMEQVEAICERIVLINAGKNVLEDEVANLKHKYKENIFEVSFDRPIETERLPTSFELINHTKNQMKVKATDRHALNDFIKSEMNAGNDLNSMQEVLPSINDIFISTVQSSSNNKVNA